jgi:hypothetical protein
MRNVTEESLFEMLTTAKLPQLPEINNPDKTWVKAIVKILRKTGKIDYAIAEHDLFSYDEVRVLKEIGGVGVYHELLGIYPYVYLTEKYIPEVKNKKDMIDFILSRNPDMNEAEVNAMKKEEVKKYFLKCCIKEQITRMNTWRTMNAYQLGQFEPEISKTSEVISSKEKNDEEEKEGVVEENKSEIENETEGDNKSGKPAEDF